MENQKNLEALLTAIAAEDDAATEAAVAHLSMADEPALLALLADADADQRWWAVRALGAWGSVAAVAPLLGLLDQEDAALRAVTAMTISTILQRLPDAATMQPHLSPLTKLLTDQDGLTRQVAADALAQCGNAAIPALIEVLRFGTNQGARSRAAYALGKIGTMEAAPALYRCLNDPNYLVHTYAHEALEKLGLLENVLMMP